MGFTREFVALRIPQGDPECIEWVEGWRKKMAWCIIKRESIDAIESGLLNKIVDK